eukprot:TRINITY_DN11194_c0_g1_i1.p1 TRINITY_DN11194_c0_g1~~TRINITY_DN11194_c0_g1_i1.p1  ORF type:complete len:145 (+),score=9.78 TRINITY_DN11194_c0_g1_i1:454-888(+)
MSISLPRVGGVGRSAVGLPFKIQGIKYFSDNIDEIVDDLSNWFQYLNTFCYEQTIDLKTIKGEYHKLLSTKVNLNTSIISAYKFEGGYFYTNQNEKTPSYLGYFMLIFATHKDLTDTSPDGSIKVTSLVLHYLWKRPCLRCGMG